MFSGGSQELRSHRAFLKRQRKKAREHRRYMDMRRTQKKKSTTQKFVGDNPARTLTSRKSENNSISFFKTLTNRFVSLVVSVVGFIGLGLKNIFGVYIPQTFSWLKKVLRITVSRCIGFVLMLQRKIYDVFGSGDLLDSTISMKKNMKKKKEKKEKSVTSGLKTKNKKKKTGIVWVKRLFWLFFALALFGFGLFFAWFSTLEIPSLENFENRKISNSTKIYDKTGEILLYDIHDNIRRTVVESEDISQNAKDAIIAIEDHNFYEHDGVVWKSTARAVFQSIMTKLGLSNAGLAGGSTLTQQVVKNTLLNRDRVISRKVKEWVLAYKIENQLTKDQILEIYLNEAPYGGTIYGIQEASTRFFGVPASEVSVAQSAYLAAIPNAPTFYSPYGQNIEALEDRKNTVLREMQRYGFISESQYRDALLEDVEFLPEEDGFAKSLHFVQFIRAQLEDRYGVDVVENGGLQVITTLDYELQQKAEEIIRNHVEEVEEEYNASNAALVAIEAETGHIISMVGSRDYFDTEDFDGNFNVALSPRQPGSSFKPFAYAAAFEKGYLPESTLFDTQTQFNTRCDVDDFSSLDGCYSPKNYDSKFVGPMTFRDALAQSRNIPAIKVNYLAGVSNVIKLAEDFGITSLTESPSYYGLGLVLGGGEVSLFEMTSAYTVFANDGRYSDPIGILEVSDFEGNIIDSFESDDRRVLDQNAARMVNSVLSDNVARTPLFGPQSFLYFGDRDVAAKTGTTNDNRDAWLIGYTPEVSVGVWTGNNNNTPMGRGSSISGKPWRQFMDEVMEEYSSNKSFGDYDLPNGFSGYPNMIRGDWYGGEVVTIDTVSGKLATEFTPESTRLDVPIPDPHNLLHWINKNNPLVLDSSRSDSQYDHWEYSVQEYVNNYLSEIININFEIPTEYDDVHTEGGIVDSVENDFEFSIRGISDQVYGFDDEIEISIRSSDRDEDEIEKIQIFINNAFVANINSEPFEYVFTPSNLQYFEEENVLRVIVEDEDGLTATEEEIFILDFS